MANGVWPLNSSTGQTEVGTGRWYKKFGADTDGVFATGDLLVSQRGAGANKSVDVAAGDVLITTIAGTSCYHGFETATTNVAITDNASGNPRWDAISVYIDVAAFGASDNSGATKFKATAGTPAASPSKPSGATIQADVGANNPYHILGYVYVPNGFTQVVNANNGTDGYIVDDRGFAQSIEQVRWRYDSSPEEVVTGLQPATGASLTSDISVGEAYVRGRYVAKQRAESHLYTASKDTYVDINSSHAFQYTEVTLGAAEPAVASNSIRLAKVVTSGAAITSVTDLRNLYARGHVESTSALNLTTTATTVPGLSATFSVSQACYIRVFARVQIEMASGTAPCNLSDAILITLDIDGADDSNTPFVMCQVANIGRQPVPGFWLKSLSAGAHTISIQANNSVGNRGATHNLDNSFDWEIIEGA